MLTHVIRNQEWLDANSGRHYPFTADSSGISQDGLFTLPEDFVVACQIFFPFFADLDISRCFLRKLISDPLAGYQLIFAASQGSQVLDIARCDIPRGAHHPFKAYPIQGLNRWVEAVGTLVINRLESIDQQPAGEFVFGPENARLETDAIRPMLRGIPYLVVRNGAEVSPPIYGPVVFRAGYNCRLETDTVMVEGSVPTHRISIHAISGEGLNVPCTKGLEDPPIRYLNGATPSADGHLVLQGSDCIRIVPIRNGLRIENTCAQACCGEEELELLTREAERLRQQIDNLEYFMNRIDREVSSLKDSLMSSKLGEGGCFACD